MKRALDIAVAILLIQGCAEGNQPIYLQDGAPYPDGYQQVDMSTDVFGTPDVWGPPPADIMIWPDTSPPKDAGSPPDSGIKDSTPHDSATPDTAGACPDQYEPNDACSLGKSLGTVGEGSTWISNNATLDPGTDLDWFWAVGEESASFCLPGTSQCFNFTVRVQVPAGRMFRLCVYEGPCSATPVCADNASIPGPLQLEVKYTVDGTCAFNDDTTARIKVEQLDSTGGCPPYSVEFNYDAC